MPDAFSEIESRLRACEDALVALTRRIHLLEEGERPSLAIAEPPVRPPRPPPRSVDYSGVLSLIGRTCMVLGGAFLLRALTDSGRLASEGGVSLGFAYAVAWFGAADYAGRLRPISGLFHGVAGVLIGFPLLWEASTRFQLLSPTAAAPALAALTLSGLVVAWHRRLPALAGLAIAVAVVTSLALAVAGGGMLAQLIVMVVLTLATSWLSVAREWPWLKWPAALAANAMTLAIAARAGSDAPLAPSTPALMVVVAMMAAALAASAVQSVVQRRRVSAFEAAHAMLTLAVGTVACLAIAPHVSDLADHVVRTSLIMIGLAAYAAALFVQRRDAGARSAFHFFALLGLMALVAGSLLALSGVVRHLALSTAAISCVWLARTLGGRVLAAHAAMYVVILSVSTGLLRCLTEVWLMEPSAWPSFPPNGWLALGTALTGGLLPRGAPTRPVATLVSMSRLILAVVVTATAVTVLVLLLRPLAAAIDPNPGGLATLKTLLISVTAIALAVIRRAPFGGELGWLCYPVLAAGAAKLVIEDFRVSSPATLFIALAMFGAALIIAARLGRPRREVTAT